MHKCSMCKIEKEKTEFFKDSRKKNGIRSHCKDCCQRETKSWRERNRSEYNSYVAQWRAKNPDRQHKTEIKRNYGISIEKYNEMLTAQSCKCLICSKQHDPTIKKGRLFVDHDHQTGEVRGLLCGKCNMALGLFNDNIDLIKKAISYLA